MKVKMTIGDFSNMCAGGNHNTLSVERPISQDKPNEILFTGKFNSAFMPPEISNMEFYMFSVNGTDRDLRADVVIYV